MTLFGYITWYLYLAPSPLRCGGVYTDTVAPWIAMDIDAGHAVCGDDVTIIMADGTIIPELKVRDSGPLSKYCIRERGGNCVPIIGDIPLHGVWREGLSTKVMLVNESMGTRTRETAAHP